MYKQYSNTFGLLKYIYDGNIQKRKVLRFFCGWAYLAKTKVLISCTVTMQLICAFVFAYAKSRFSHDAAHIKVKYCIFFITVLYICRNLKGERGGSVVECLTLEPEVRGRNLPPSCCVLEQDTLLPDSTGNTKVVVALSQHD